MGTRYYAINETNKHCYELGSGDWDELNFNEPLRSQIRNQISHYSFSNNNTLEDYIDKIYTDLLSLSPTKIIERFELNRLIDFGEYTIIGTRYGNYNTMDFPMFLSIYFYDYELI